MRAAVYSRVSTAEQRDEGLSLDLQRHQCEEQARRDGAVSVEFFEDGGISGAKADNRPALQELLKSLEDFDSVYVYKLDRLARSVRDAANIMHTCEKAAVRLVCLSENFDLNTIMGRAMASMAAVFAELELATIRQRVRAAVAERRRQGRRLGRPPFGYKSSAIKGEPMEPDPNDAPLLQELFRRYAAGEPAWQLTHWLNEVRGPVGWGKQWYAQTVILVLSNPAYIGKMRSKGEVLPAQHEPLIDDDLWRQVRDRLGENALIAPNARAHSLSPVFRCGLCGGPMKRQHNGPGEGQRAFGCTRRAELPRAERHPAVWVSDPKAVALAWKAVGYLISEDAIAEAHSRMMTADSNAERVALLRERQKLDDAIAYNLAAARAGAIDIALLARENAPLNARRAEVDRLLAEEQKAIESIQGLCKVTSEELLETVQLADIERQRRFLLRFFKYIEVHKGFLRFVPTIPDVKPFDVAIPKYYAPKRGGRFAEVDFCILTS